MASWTKQNWDRQEFESALAELVRTAEGNDVDLVRAMDVEGMDEGCRWMIEISQVKDPESSRQD